MAQPLDDDALDRLFRTARTYPRWLDRPVGDDELRALYGLAKWGPTSIDCLPARFVFLRTPEAKDRLIPALSPGNVDKVRGAPVTAIVAYDTRFYELLSELWPHNPAAAEPYARDPELAELMAFRNGTL
jgi:3-hydroxypropanoate dehydrogenase